MKESQLVELGFTSNEAKVYFALIGLGSTEAHRIIIGTKLHKSVVYDNLYKLIDRGLISFVTEGKKKIFSAANGQSFIHYFEEQEKRIAQQKKDALIFAQNLDKLAVRSQKKDDAAVFRGINGVKSFFRQTMADQNPQFAFGAPQESVDSVGAHFWRNLNLVRVENKIPAKMIFNSRLRSFAKGHPKKHTEIRFFDGDFEPLTETFIQGDKVAICVWKKEPLLFVINDASVAQSYKKYFDILWKQSQK